MIIVKKESFPHLKGKMFKKKIIENSHSILTTQPNQLRITPMEYLGLVNNNAQTRKSIRVACCSTELLFEKVPDPRNSPIYNLPNNSQAEQALMLLT